MNNQLAPRHPYFNICVYLLLATLWSGSFINIKVVVDVLPPIFSAMMRVLISLVCFTLFFLVTRKQVFLLPKKYWPVWVAGLFTQAFPFMFLFYGEKFVAPGLASILNSTVSLWSLILGTLLFRDLSEWTPLKVAGVILAFSGIILIFYPMLSDGENSVIGVCAILGMAISYAIGGLINQFVIFKNKNITFEINLFQQNLSSTLCLLLVSLSVESWSTLGGVFDLKVVLSFLYLGVMATAVAWLIYFHLIREWSAVRAASVTYLVPLLAIFWDYLFLHLVPGKNEILGAVAILLGVILIQWVRKKRMSS